MFLKSNKIYFYIILLFSFSCKKEPLIEKYKDVSLKDKKFIFYIEKLILKWENLYNHII